MTGRDAGVGGGGKDLREPGFRRQGRSTVRRDTKLATGGGIPTVQEPGARP